MLWERYIQLTQIEAAFKTLKSELGLRPIYHQVEKRVEAHIFVAFLAYALHATLRRRLRRTHPHPACVPVPNWPKWLCQARLRVPDRPFRALFRNTFVHLAQRLPLFYE